MSESPGLKGASREQAADALTELVAVKLYLSGDSHTIDTAVRSATVGPHIPLARCVAAGLQRLPSYRGPALLRAPVGPDEGDWFREGRVVTEWAFCTARTEWHEAPAGSTNFLIWSMTARRTNLLDRTIRDRVIFIPGTSFKVLNAESDGLRSHVMLRELSAGEADQDGRVVSQSVPLDEIALDGLQRTAAILESGQLEQAISVEGPPAVPPGLLPQGRRGNDHSHNQ
ncbi:hypothetical protein ACWGJX_37135 [Streptomyces sp. NPDC054775]